MNGVLLTASILSTAGDLMTWVLAQGSAILDWAVKNPYVIILLVMFIAGFAVSMIARIIYSL